MRSLVILTLVWPLIHLSIFFLRFQRLPFEMVVESLTFLPLGLLSALIFKFFRDKSKSELQKKAVLIGYIIAFPFALIFSLFGGLVFTPIIAVTIYGLIPLIIGMGIGYLIKKPKLEKLVE